MMTRRITVGEVGTQAELAARAENACYRHGRAARPSRSRRLRARLSDQSEPEWSERVCAQRVAAAVGEAEPE
eukprot:3434241-Rhodomonas_salina.1